MITLTGVARTYPGDVPVEALRPMDLVVDQGEFISIEGPSGSGKSTLMNLLGLLDMPSAGSYVIDGVETTTLGEVDRTSLRGAYFGFVFQSAHLLADRSAQENVELGLLYQGIVRRERRRRAAHVLEQVGLAHRTHALPRTMSGGERKRVAIARALAARAPVMLCDEPTGNLDQVGSLAILELLEELNDTGLTVIIVTHDPEIARRPTRHLFVRDGRVSS